LKKKSELFPTLKTVEILPKNFEKTPNLISLRKLPKTSRKVPLRLLKIS